LKRFLAIIIGFFAFATLVVIGAFLVMPRTDVVMIVHSLPVIGSHANKFGEIKSEINETASHFVDDTLYGVKLTWRSISEFSLAERPQRVVIELEPIRTKRQNQITPPPVPMAKTEKAPEPVLENPVTQTEPTSTEPPPTPVTMADASTASTSEAPSENQMPAAEMGSTEEISSAAEPAVISQPPETQPRAPEPEPIVVEMAPEKKANPREVTAEQATATIEEETPPAATKTVSMKTASLRPPKKPPPPAPKIDTGGEEHKQGLTYYKGIGGVEKNFKTAAKWFRASSLKGNAAAQYNLGIMAYLGQGEEQSYEQAASWFRQAANQDHALAQYNLGFLFYEGKGVEKDDLQAFMWIDRAARLGDEKAVKARETLEKILPKDILKGR